MSQRPPLDIDPRAQARFSASQRFHILLRCATDGIARCDVCEAVVANLSPDGHWIAAQPYEFDHEKARALGGKTHEENGRALCVPCHKQKSASDVAMISKADRAGGREGSQWLRRLKRKAAGIRSPIQSRGFRNG